MIDAGKQALKIFPSIGTINVDACCNMAGIIQSGPGYLKGSKLSIAHLILGVLTIPSIRFISSAEKW